MMSLEMPNSGFQLQLLEGTAFKMEGYDAQFWRADL
jgi:hypothetical protein